MKRLRKFNESVSQIDYNYVYECFSELIDENKVEIELIEGNYRMFEGNFDDYITLRLRTSPKMDPRTTSQLKPLSESHIHLFIKEHNNNNELLQEAEVSFKRLSDKYPDYRIKFTDYGTSIFIEIFNSNKKEEQYPF